MTPRPSAEKYHRPMSNTIINIGREFGSGGKSVALELGKLLDIPVYDQELITKAAEESGLSASLFSRNDEKHSLFDTASFFPVSRFGSIPHDSAISDENIFRIQSETIRGIADRSDAIFIGRASDYVLRERRCLDVFICAPLNARIERISSRLGLEPERARKLIEKTDRSRREYYDFFTQGHWGVASNYDLCIDSSVLGIEQTALAIVDFARRAGILK